MIKNKIVRAQLFKLVKYRSREYNRCSGDLVVINNYSISALLICSIEAKDDSGSFFVLQIK